MVRFNDKAQINSLANNDIMPITDMSDATDDRKVTVEQLSQFTVDNIPALSGGKTLTDNNLTNALKNNYDTAYTNQDLTKYDENISYPKGYWVTGFIEDKKVIKESMIDDNLGNLLTDETKWKDVIDNSRASINLDNLSEEGETHFLNKTQITNCILSAPNGVATYSGNTITVKTGLKVLIPNGRNVDGTLNNIEYTVPNDIEYTVPTSTGSILMVLELLSSDIVSSHSYQSYIISDETPVDITSTNAVWYNPKENTTSITSNAGESWIVSPRTFLGLYELNINQVTSLTPYQPVELLKRSDKEEITGWGYLSKDRIVSLTLGASKQEYPIQYTGKLYIDKSATSAGQSITLENIGIYALTNYSVSANDAIRMTIDVKAGDTVRVTYTANGHLTSFDLRVAEGAK